MQHLCDAPYIGAAADYIGNIVNVTGFIPSAGGGTATEEICDYYYQYSEVGRDYWRVVRVGGGATAVAWLAFFRCLRLTLGRLSGCIMAVAFAFNLE